MNGRKIRAFRADPCVCFELDGKGALVTYGNGEKACDFSYVICSAMGNGRIDFIEDLHEKQRALALIARHQSGKDVPVPNSSLADVAVFSLTVEAVTTRKKNC